jgi:hypothetical protein
VSALIGQEGYIVLPRDSALYINDGIGPDIMFWNGRYSPITPTNDTVIYLSDLLKWWDEYKVECYNDSTLIKRMADVGNLLVYRTETVWIHTSPTFDGFMEFLKKKNERKVE